MIYIGIPARNERQTIGPLLWRIRELLLRRSRDFQVVVVDDASTDGTSEALLPYQRVLPLTVLRNEARAGYAASLEKLVREVVQRSDYLKRDALVTLQADFTNAPEDIPELVRRFEGGADLVVAMTRSEGAAPRRVRLATAGARLVGRFMPSPEGIDDTLGSFRLYRLFTLARAISDLPDAEARLLCNWTTAGATGTAGSTYWRSSEGCAECRATDNCARLRRSQPCRQRRADRGCFAGHQDENILPSATWNR